jgi:CRISPR-associated protein Csm2
MEVKFYSDKQRKVLNPELFSSHAESWAKTVCESGLKLTVDKRTNKEKKVLEKNKISQIRKFYDEAWRFSDYLNSGEKYELLLPHLYMLNAKAAYAEGRKLITSEFKMFLRQSLDYLSDNDQKTFDTFRCFFEAFMGYYKFYEAQYKGAEG